MLLNSGEFKFLKNYRNVNVKSSAKRKYRDEHVFLKVDRALSKLITLLISNKKEFNHFFSRSRISRSSGIVLLKLDNLHQNAKRYEAHNTECEVHICRSAKRATRKCERSEQIFTFSSEKVLDLCKMWPPRFCQMSTFWDPLNPKKWFLRMCLSVYVYVDFSLLAR